MSFTSDRSSPRVQNLESGAVVSITEEFVSPDHSCALLWKDPVPVSAVHVTIVVEYKNPNRTETTGVECSLNIGL